MLCDEQGQFFEIAQVIVRLDLTILKGSIETRADNNWAHFIVEVVLILRKPSFCFIIRL